MNKKVTENELQDAILLLEKKKDEERNMLKDKFHGAYEKLKPVNIVKSMLHETVTNRAVRNKLLEKTVNVGLILLTNIILRKNTNSIVKRTLGTALVFGIKTILKRNPGIVKAAGTGIINTLGKIAARRNRKREYRYQAHMQ